jgi:26S proteasome non-ATPase regulatory subunit 9
MTAAPLTTLQTKITQLSDKRKEIEAEISTNMEVLKKNNIGMTEPLVDSEGFPLATVDVVSVRKSRVKIIELRNDYEKITNEMSSVLIELHQQQQSKEVVTPSDPTSAPHGTESSGELKPFALVDGVFPDSPADVAGFARNDLILEFGTVKGSGATLEKISAEVASNENKEIKVKIKRNNSMTDLILIPQKWEGRGLVGFHVVPM